MSESQLKAAVQQVAKQVGARKLWLELVKAGLSDSTARGLINGSHRRALQERTADITEEVLAKFGKARAS